jgi:glucose/mannose transport system substrate-binding protein
MMNKLRAQIIAGDPPAASQLKGPEIAAWSKIAPVVDLDAQVKAAGYEAVVPAELARLSKPHGHWIALPIQAYRINTLFMPKKAAERVGVDRLPTTWAEFDAIAEKMKAAGITPVANGGLKWDDRMPTARQ